MADTNQNKSNYTNLRDTYFNDKVSGRTKFYKYYFDTKTNDNNGIDDPIFTGFTFDIDSLHSPLFYTGTGDTFTTSETLYGGGDTSLAAKIEERLETAYSKEADTINGYDIDSIYIKDAINDSRRAGYGLEEYMEMPTINFGALDYIYMVDKVTKYDGDETEGSASVGDGTPDNYVEIYDTQTYVVNEDELWLDEVNGQSATATASLATALANSANRKYNALMNLNESSDYSSESSDISTQHKYNLDDSNEAKVNLENALNKTDSGGYTYEQLIAGQKMLKGLVNSDKKEVTSELLDIYINPVTKELNTLKDSLATTTSSTTSSTKSSSTSSTSSTSSSTETTETATKTPDATAKQNIDTIYRNYEVYWNDIQNKTMFSELDITITRTENFDTELNKLSTDEKQVSDQYKKAWIIQSTKITNIKVSDATNEKLRNYQERINAFEKELYGTDSNGNPLTQATASDDSLYGKYKQAVEKSKTDSYSQTMESYQSDLNLNDMLNEMGLGYSVNPNLLSPDSGDSDSTSTTTTTATTSSSSDSTSSDTSQTATPTTDNTGTNDENQTRSTFEPSQTVYDMIGFITGMDKLTHEYPYVMQSVTGLDEAYKNYFVLKDPYQGSGDNKITITCYESLDLRVSSMFNKYLNAAYDRKYKRERLPMNLRRFTCSVFVHDIRNFRDALSRYTNSSGTYLFPRGDNGDSTKSKIVEIALNYVSAIEFKFYDCEIVPEETGGIFDSVSNGSAGDMKTTNFSFIYGNCVINFLPFADLKKYYSTSTETTREKLKQYTSGDTTNDNDGVLGKIDDETPEDTGKVYDTEMSEASSIDGNFRRWFDSSSLGNVNNNDYRDYIRESTTVTVDDYYRSTLVDNFAMNSVVSKNQEIDELNNALRKIAVGISASTGIPVKGVTDALNISYIDPIITKEDEDVPVVKKIGNVNNSKVVNAHTSEYIGNVFGKNNNKPDTSTSIGNVNVTEPESTGTSTEIGHIDGYDVQDSGTSTEIGHIDGYDVQDSGTSTSIGQIDGYDVQDSGTSTSIGHIDGYDVQDSGTSTEIGHIDGYDVQDSGTSTEIGHIDGYDVQDSGTSTSIGHIDGYDVQDSGTSTSIGHIDGYDVQDSGTAKDLGQIDGYGNTKSTTVTDLGNVNGDTANGEEVKNLGKVDMESKTGKIVTDLGKV